MFFKIYNILSTFSTNTKEILQSKQENQKSYFDFSFSKVNIACISILCALQIFKVSQTFAHTKTRPNKEMIIKNNLTSSRQLLYMVAYCTFKKGTKILELRSQIIKLYN